MTPVPALLHRTALLSYGVRPFFLFGSIYAGLAALAWLPVFYGELSAATTFIPRDWHVHEMIYGCGRRDHRVSTGSHSELDRASAERPSDWWRSVASAALLGAAALAWAAASFLVWGGFWAAPASAATALFE